MARKKRAGTKKRNSVARKKRKPARRRSSARVTRGYAPPSAAPMRMGMGGSMGRTMEPRRDHTMLYVVIVFVMIAVVVLAVAAQTPGGLGGIFGGTTLAATTQSATSSYAWVGYLFLGLFLLGAVTYGSSLVYRAEGGEGAFREQAFSRVRGAGGVARQDYSAARDTAVRQGARVRRQLGMEAVAAQKESRMAKFKRGARNLRKKLPSKRPRINWEKNRIDMR